MTIAVPSSPTLLRRPRVVVLGNVTKMPVGGVVWQTLHYLLGLEALGFDVWYVEAHARTPSMLMRTEHDDSSMLAATFIERMLEPFGLGQRWAFHALHDDGRVLGMSSDELIRLYDSAAVILNLHGGTAPREEHVRTGRLVYVETDPVQLQVELLDGVPETIKFLDAHCAYFTFGENYGRPSCRLPVTDRYTFHPTRQPVVLSLWPLQAPVTEAFTTIGNWRQLWRPVSIAGVTLTWSKHVEFERVIDLPRDAPMPLELALSSAEAEDVDALRSRGWRVRQALPFSADRDLYRSYVTASAGEFTVAKEQNVATRSGWFSDRSATYLAAGRPVITQDTGFGEILPTGTGLFAFTDRDEALDALQQVARDPERHRRGARAIAHDFFAHDVVLGAMFHELGVAPPRRPRATAVREQSDGRLPMDLDLTVVSKRPIELRPETVAYLRSRPVGSFGPHRAAVAAPVVSVIVPTCDNLVFLRLALESALLAAVDVSFELVVVSNGAAEEVLRYLDALAHDNPLVRTVRRAEPIGFAAAVNLGVEAARGEILVLLNDDVVVSDGWLDLLVAGLVDPEVALVGPLTPQADGLHRVPHAVTSFEGFLQLAEQQRLAAEQPFDVDMLRMFCVALTRTTWGELGALDEGFEVGMFEDDDYCRRALQRGRLLRCVPEVVVHHFGEATLGHLFASGTHARVFETNRQRFEDRWAERWSPRRSDAVPDARYDAILAATRRALDAMPAGSAAAVISRGDDRLLASSSSIDTVHFPFDEVGEFAGHYPASDVEAVALLRSAGARGITHVVVPATTSWWLEHYPAFSSALVETSIGTDPELVRVLAIG